MKTNRKKQCLQNAEQLLTVQMEKVSGGKRKEDERYCEGGCLPSCMNGCQAGLIV
jgi:hypothetical protein